MAAVVAAHLLFALALMRPPAPAPSVDDEGLDVVFVLRALPSARPAAARTPATTESVSTARSARTVERTTGLVAEVVERGEPEVPELSATEGAPIAVTTADDTWDAPARSRPAPGRDFRRNPLERPSADLVSMPRQERFRMRRERTPEDVVKGVAQFVGLWPPGYTTDPCPEISREVTELSQAGDAESRRQLEIAVDRERRYCR